MITYAADEKRPSKPVLFLQMVMQAFERNNPGLEFVGRIMELVQFYTNYTSNQKLHRFRHMMYRQQMNRMEEFVSERTIYHYRGNKMDRKF
ncbi:MAG: hypothetical protein KC476_02135 [Cyanobacteria bacterium HKST-UBA06]|nr:hypothetical protein [Cyanobacteria bacterium HKST-UBA05]MCA9798242.1 hypothetical protein [Cyanobacteria bacterium HKST-UBA04]MCA9806728.1 hypothetical protein [Cyanobacteria bacterium HKST-UBA06]MCA9841195.1 hypothetical protein [Cyanobacteria bacterium HKST-UBA03]